jgi:hypothetical protein
LEIGTLLVGHIIGLLGIKYGGRLVGLKRKLMPGDLVSGQTKRSTSTRTRAVISMGKNDARIRRVRAMKYFTLQNPVNSFGVPILGFQSESGLWGTTFSGQAS